MLEPRGRLDLAQEALRGELRGALSAQDLERDGPPVAHLVREVDGRHPAAPDLALDHVAGTQLVEEGGVVGHASSPRAAR